MFSSVRTVNEHGGLVATRPDGSEVYLPPGSAWHTQALAGTWGPVLPLSPQPPARWKVRRSTLIERMTDDELAALETLIAALPLRNRELWQAVSYVWSDDARVLAAAAALAWSAERVAELLAVDPGADMLPD